MRGATRGGGRRLLVAAAAIGLGFGAAAAWAPRAAAQTPTVVQAEGDAYSVFAEASLLGGGPIHVGPVSPAQAYVPGSTDPSRSTASLVNCTSGVCVDPLVDGINVLQSNADASRSGVTTRCEGAPAGFGGDHIVGGNACVTIASVSALNSGSADKPTPQVFASAVTAESQMQGCDDKKAVGKVEIANLTVGGTEVVGPQGIDLTPAPNTVISIGVITVILNEQHYDNQGHGFTVNAIHVFTSADLGSLANVDLVIGHAHSEDMCDTGTQTTPPSNPGSSGQNLPIGTKADNTKSADRGEVVTYTLTVTSNSCEVVSLTDTLPPGFSLVAGSASGDLQQAPIPSQPTATQQVLEWYNPGGFLKSKLVETFKVKIAADVPNGYYVNTVSGDSSPAASDPTSACGTFVFSDTLPLDGPIPANNGNNPGIIVPRSGASPAPTNGVQALTPTSLPNTSGSSPAGWATPLGLLALLGGATALRRRVGQRRT